MQKQIDKKSRYPHLLIRSKNELAKHISDAKFSKNDALDLINRVLKDYDHYWRESSESEPEKGKYVRDAKGTPLGLLLNKIDKKVLARHDSSLPNFIFGGLRGLNHIKAGKHLLGGRRKRVLLAMDIHRFFEHISAQRVNDLFRYKCGCSEEGAKLLTRLCCVPAGPKGSKSSDMILSRGFATSPRLAVWCNLDTFIKLDYAVKKKFKDHDPRLAIYVDDIGITASRVTKEDMYKFADQVEEILNADSNQPLPVNTTKTKVMSHEEGLVHLGLRLFRNKLSIDGKSLAKRNRLREKIREKMPKEQKKSLRKIYRSLTAYKQRVENVK